MSLFQRQTKIVSLHLSACFLFVFPACFCLSLCALCFVCGFVCLLRQFYFFICFKGGRRLSLCTCPLLPPSPQNVPLHCGEKVPELFVGPRAQSDSPKWLDPPPTFDPPQLQETVGPAVPGRADEEEKLLLYLENHRRGEHWAQMTKIARLRGFSSAKFKKAQKSWFPLNSKHPRNESWFRIFLCHMVVTVSRRKINFR